MRLCLQCACARGPARALVLDSTQEGPSSGAGRARSRGAWPRTLLRGRRVGSSRGRAQLGLGRDLTPPRPPQDGALETVAALTALTSLSLRGCSGLSDAAPARLAPLVQLRHLALGGPAVSDAGLVHCIVLTGAPCADAPPAPPCSLGGPTGSVWLGRVQTGAEGVGR